MNENWLEIVDANKSASFSSLNHKEFSSMVKGWIRMLGWRKHNGSMQIDVIVNDNKCIPIVLYSQTEQEMLPALPIFVSFGSDINSLQHLKESLNVLNCNKAISFNKEDITLYYLNQSNEINKVASIKFDTDNQSGATLLNILDTQNFDCLKLEKYFEDLYNSVARISELHEAISNINIDQDLFLSFIKDELLSQGFNEKQIISVLADYHFVLINKKINLVPDNIVLETESIKSDVQYSHDNTRFSIDGVNFFNKRNFVHHVVKRYIMDNPSVTLEDLEARFPSHIISKKRGVVRPLETVMSWVKENPALTKRFCLKPEEILTLADGSKIVVYNQWGTKFPAFLNIARQLYDVVSDKPYVYDKPGKTVSSAQEPNANENPTGITISETSLKTFATKL